LLQDTPVLKVVKIILGSLAAVWTLGVVVGVVLQSEEYFRTGGESKLVAGIAATLICLLLTVLLFQSAFATSTASKSEHEKA